MSVSERPFQDTPRYGGPGHSASGETSSGDPVGDSPAGPLVRPYTMTRGRTRPRDGTARLDMITIVMAAHDPGSGSREPEQEAILRLCRKPMSVAELSARLDLPLTVVKVLLSDLVADGDVRTRAAVPVARLPEKKILQAVLDGIRRL